MVLDSKEANRFRIAIFDKEGDILHIFSDPNPLIEYSVPKWAPDGKKIAFVMSRFDEAKGYSEFAIAMIELDSSLQSGPRLDKIPNIRIVTFNVYLYGGITIGIILLVIAGFLSIRRKKKRSQINDI
jgi:Tol biopolymer transport system component